MGVVIGVLAAVAGAFWAFRYFVTAAQEGRDAVAELRGFFRGAKWSKKIDQRLVENLDDPREAAAVLLFQMASYDGAVTDRQKAAMQSEMRAAFSADDEMADALYAFARMALGEIHDASNSLRKVLRSVAASCTDDEKKSFVAMLTRVGETEGPLNDAQRRLIDETRRFLLPPKR